jgi:hypothetical protein
VSDIDTAAVDSLKVLDPNRPIREADIDFAPQNVRFRGWIRQHSAALQSPLVTQQGRIALHV